MNPSVTDDYKNATDGTKVIADDPWLSPYAQTLRDRFSSNSEFFKFLDSFV
jgi:hypothetical protein